MENKKRFIMKSAVTVCLLAVLSMEGLYLYCHYVEHTSVLQFASKKLDAAQEWFAHSGTQMANAQPPSRKGDLTSSSAAPAPIIHQTAGYAVQQMIEENGFMIPETSPASLSSNVPAAQDTTTTPTPLEESTEKIKKAKTKKVKKTKTSPTPTETDAPPAEDTATIQDLIKRQEKDGYSQNTDPHIQLAAESILQYPELPTGCEVTSLTMALRFAGYDVSKEELADQYLEKTSPGTVSYKTAFWGDPRQAESFGCYAPVIVNAANRYLTAQGSGQRAYDLTGTPLDDILMEIRMGFPVIVWGSMYINEEIIFSYGWEIEGETVTWPSNEHCMLLIGFDTENNSVIVCDPLEGIVSYDKNAFQHHYDTLEQQAIVIY